MKTISCEVIIPESLHERRLDQALAQLLPEYSRTMLQSWITQGAVTIGGKPIQQRTKAKCGDVVNIQATLEEHDEWAPEQITLNVVYEDDDVLVINKPVGLVVHPAAGNYAGTLANALLHYSPQLKQLPRAGIVHRLDKDTSGLLVVAKTLAAHTYLVKQLQTREVHREYYALVHGELTSGGTIDAPLGRHPKFRTRRAVAFSGKKAVTHYRLLERFPIYTLIKVILETGRTHQIRAHMAHIHHPLVGDKLYGGRVVENFSRQALHAWRLSFAHPITKKMLEFTAEMPEDMQALLKKLRDI